MRIKFGHPILIRNLAAMCGGRIDTAYQNDALQAVTHLTTHSKEVLPGDVFIAIETDKQNGHLFISEAVTNGASAILYHMPDIQKTEGVSYILCDNTMYALSNFAKSYAEDIPHKTIAVTGSVGKTTTKRFISSVLKQQYHVHESPLNYNNLLGCCLHMLTMPPNTDILLAECGMSASGEIETLSKLLRPDYAVITNIGISHIETLGTQECICHAKLEITKGMRNGMLFCEGNDRYLRRMAPPDTVYVSFTDISADYHAKNVSQEVSGIGFLFYSPNTQVLPMYIPTLGMHTLSCAMFAISLGIVLDVPPDKIRRGLSEYVPENMRQTIIQIENTTVLFDAYNACPASMRAACETVCLLAERCGGEKIIVIGDMAELGEKTKEAHIDVGALFARTKPKCMILWGEHANLYIQGLGDAGFNLSHTMTFPKEYDIQSISDYISRQISPCDVLLIKGSRSMRMERLLPALQEKLSKSQFA